METNITVTGAEAHGYLRELIEDVPAEAGQHIELVLDDSLREEQYRVDSTGGRARVSAGSRRGLIYGARELLRRSTASGSGTATLVDGRFEGEPALPYRLYWTWDHSTNWDILQIGQQESGAFNMYEKQPEAFVSDYRRLIRHMADRGVNGLVVYGLLREGHNGLDAARELCAVARDHGIRLLAGIAANSYGGTFYEGEHPYNLATWLDANPELEARFADMPGFHIDDYGRVPFLRSDLSRAADSTRPENLTWTLESIDWLIQELDLGGINVEFGDYAGNDALEDMKRILPAIIERIRSHSDDLWIVTDLGWDALADPALPAKLEGLPEDCVYEFTFNRSYWDTLRAGVTRETISALPMSKTILRGQIGTQWNQQRYHHIGRQFAEMAQLAAATGMVGVSMFSEVSDFSVPNEFNYLAFAEFSIDPQLDWDDFVAAQLAPRLGGAEAAAAYLGILEELQRPGADAAALRERMRAAAPEDASEDVARRWLWLAYELERHIWNAAHA